MSIIALLAADRLQIPLYGQTDEEVIRNVLGCLALRFEETAWMDEDCPPDNISMDFWKELITFSLGNKAYVHDPYINFLCHFQNEATFEELLSSCSVDKPVLVVGVDQKIDFFSGTCYAKHGLAWLASRTETVPLGALDDVSSALMDLLRRNNLLMVPTGVTLETMLEQLSSQMKMGRTLPVLSNPLVSSDWYAYFFDGTQDVETTQSSLFASACALMDRIPSLEAIPAVNAIIEHQDSLIYSLLEFFRNPGMAIVIRATHIRVTKRSLAGFICTMLGALIPVRDGNITVHNNSAIVTAIRGMEKRIKTALPPTIMRTIQEVTQAEKELLLCKELPILTEGLLDTLRDRQNSTRGWSRLYAVTGANGQSPDSLRDNNPEGYLKVCLWLKGLLIGTGTHAQSNVVQGNADTIAQGVEEMIKVGESIIMTTLIKMTPMTLDLAQRNFTGPTNDVLGRLETHIGLNRNWLPANIGFLWNQNYFSKEDTFISAMLGMVGSLNAKYHNNDWMKEQFRLLQEGGERGFLKILRQLRGNILIWDYVKKHYSEQASLAEKMLADSEAVRWNFKGDWLNIAMVTRITQRQVGKIACVMCAYNKVARILPGFIFSTQLMDFMPPIEFAAWELFIEGCNSFPDVTDSAMVGTLNAREPTFVEEAARGMPAVKQLFINTGLHNSEEFYNKELQLGERMKAYAAEWKDAMEQMAKTNKPQPNFNYTINLNRTAQ